MHKEVPETFYILSISLVQVNGMSIECKSREAKQ